MIGGVGLKFVLMLKLSTENLYALLETSVERMMVYMGKMIVFVGDFSEKYVVVVVFVIKVCVIDGYVVV